MAFNVEVLHQIFKDTGTNLNPRQSLIIQKVATGTKKGNQYKLCDLC